MEIYGINISEESEGLIDSKNDIEDYDNFGIEHEDYAKGGKIMKTYDDFDRDYDVNNVTFTVFYRKLTYNDVKIQINKYYQLNGSQKYSSSLDILASYLKGQKIVKSRNSELEKPLV